MAERMTEREQFYYGKGYADGVKSVGLIAAARLLKENCMHGCQRLGGHICPFLKESDLFVTKCDLKNYPSDWELPEVQEDD